MDIIKSGIFRFKCAYWESEFGDCYGVSTRSNFKRGELLENSMTDNSIEHWIAVDHMWYGDYGAVDLVGISFNQRNGSTHWLNEYVDNFITVKINGTNLICKSKFKTKIDFYGSIAEGRIDSYSDNYNFEPVSQNIIDQFLEYFKSMVDKEITMEIIITDN